MIFVKMTPTAKEPVRSTQHSAGLDIFSDEEKIILPRQTEMIRTGLTFDLTDGEDGSEWFIDMRVRSSIALQSIMLANGAGVIDKDYAGKEIMVLLYNGGTDPYVVGQGEKVAQMLIMSHYSFVAKGVTFKYDKRIGGMGSTDGK